MTDAETEPATEHAAFPANGGDNDELTEVPETQEAARLRELIGQRLQELREHRGLSVREAAARAGLSRSFVATVERGNSEIAFSRLIRLADVYGAGITDLLEGTRSAQPEFVPASAVYVFPTGLDTVAVRYLSSPSWAVQPFRVDLDPGARLEDLRHPGDEFLHCLAGEPTIVVDGRPYPLAVGDTVVVPSETTHSYFNLTPSAATLVGGVSRLEAPARPVI